MKGLDILKNGYLETVTNDSNSLSLLGRGGGMEIMKQTVKKDKLMILFPSEEAGVQEFFYILNGEMQFEVNGKISKLIADDFLTVGNLEGVIEITAMTDVTFLSISNAMVFHALSEDITELRKIGELVERKDKYTYQHSSRVSNYAVKTASKMKLDRQRIGDLLIASILHDIGKINVPEEVLNKPGKLTNDEFDKIKKHPKDGAAMLRKTAYEKLADIVEQHHERLNGSGYPFGLSADEILLEAKIIGVCDTFDAMTEDRSYRKAFTSAYAMEEIRSLSGIQFDPEVVNAFEAVLQQENKIL